MFVAFSDTTEAVITAVFATAQSDTSFPNQGTVEASDTRWSAFFATLPASAQAALTPPTQPIVLLPQQAAAAMAAGITLTLSGSITLASTVFPTDPATQTKIGGVVTTLVASGSFPGGVSSYPMKDANGTWHSFNASQYKVVAGAIASYAATLDLIIDGNPLQATSLPAASVTLTV
ncbi:hypothetical protein [Rhodopila sp.]|uniref:DUF4376 domain-containing protein n=1 Tax=Rhodopila sp. TaxID=2480087 RepID=UPI003D09D827